MSVEEIEKLIELLGGFGMGFLVGGGVIFYVIKSYIPAYLTEKGKNLATKEDIAAITEEVESVRSGYSALLEQVRLSNQIKISAIEREQTTKKEIYMEALEGIFICHNLISGISNLNISTEEISSELTKQSGKIAKIHIVGSLETLHAVTNFMGEIGSSLMILIAERREVDPDDRLNYVKRCMSNYFAISAIFPQVILSIRKELLLEISEQEFIEIFNMNVNKTKTAFEETIRKLDS